MKYEVQEFMVSNEQQMENLEEWSSQLEERVLHYDDLVDKSKNELKETMKKEEDQEKQEEEKQKEEEQHEQKFRRRMGEELGIEKKKLEFQNSYEMGEEIVREERYESIKLAKLIITKFEGTLDWFRF